MWRFALWWCVDNDGQSNSEGTHTSHGQEIDFNDNSAASMSSALGASKTTGSSNVPFNMCDPNTLNHFERSFMDLLHGDIGDYRNFSTTSGGAQSGDSFSLLPF